MKAERKYRLLLLGRRKTDMSLIIQMKWKPNFSLPLQTKTTTEMKHRNYNGY